MKIGTDLKKLRRRIKKEKEYKEKSDYDIFIQEKLIINNAMRSKENTKEDISHRLQFLRNILRIIEDGGTGFDLAYEVEKNKEINNFLHDGILFYNVFIEIGNKKFIDLPDKRKLDYKSFKTIEDTEKYIFMVWLKDTIAFLERVVKPKGDYFKYVKLRKKKEAKDKLREKLSYCHNCGVKILNTDQEYCEKCGVNLFEVISK